jgi:hypothetical protein
MPRTREPTPCLHFQCKGYLTYLNKENVNCGPRSTDGPQPPCRWSGMLRRIRRNVLTRVWWGEIPSQFFFSRPEIIPFLLFKVHQLNMKKCSEELIAFPLIRHDQHRKRRLQQFFVAAATSLSRCYSATIGGYTDTRAHQFHFIRCRANVFTEPLPSSESRDTLYWAFA